VWLFFELIAFLVPVIVSYTQKAKGNTTFSALNCLHINWPYSIYYSVFVLIRGLEGI